MTHTAIEVQLREFYNNKEVAIFGGAGFVGRYLTDILIQAGANVLVVDNGSRGQARIDRAAYETLDISRCRTPLAFALTNKFAVFNLAAAVAGVLFNQKNHGYMFRENAELLMAPIYASQAAGVENYLQVSSVCVYPEGKTNPCDDRRAIEGKPTAANAGYSEAKRVGELVAQFSTISKSVIVRPSNIYGPHDYFDDRAHVIPALIKKALNDDIIRVYGTGQESREFIYVTDAAMGMAVALMNGEDKAVYNLGTNGRTRTTIKNLLDWIQVYTKTQAKPVEFIESEYDAGDRDRWARTDRIEALGFRAETELRVGLKSTINWYLDSVSGGEI